MQLSHRYPKVLSISKVLDIAHCRAIIDVAESQIWSSDALAGSEIPTRLTTSVRVHRDLLNVAALRIVPAKVLGWPFVGVADEAALCMKYVPGDCFGRHTDRPNGRIHGQVSLYTLLLYLNDDFQGGETLFPDLAINIKPEAGTMVAIFHGVTHEALPVRAGIKYALHTFAMFATESKVSES